MGNLSKQEEIVKNYLDKECEKDSALKDAYKPEKIKACFAWITSQAKKKAVAGCAMIEDIQVYKWARDYFYDVLPNEKEGASGEACNVEEDIETEVIEAYEESIKEDKPKKSKKQKQEEEKKIIEQNLLFEF